MPGPAATAALGAAAEQSGDIAQAGSDAAESVGQTVQTSEGLNVLLALFGLGLVVAWWRLSGSATETIDGANDAARGAGDAAGEVFDGYIDAGRGAGDVVDETIDGAQDIARDAGDAFGGLVP